MILSRRHNYIFLHCRKTAGSSIAVALSRDLGPDDLQLSGLKEGAAEGIPMTARTLAEAATYVKAHGTLTHRLEMAGLKGPAARTRRRIKAVRDSYRDQLGYYCFHARAADIRDTFPEDWARARKFCVVRNPWDKMISDYYWRTRNQEQPPSFDRFVRAMRDGDPLDGIIPVGVTDNWLMYTIDNQIVADEVIRYERLATDLPAALARLDIPFDGRLPRAKGSHRPRTKRGEVSYTPELQQIVADMCAREIEAFGYA